MHKTFVQEVLIASRMNILVGWACLKGAISLCICIQALKNGRGDMLGVRALCKLMIGIKCLKTVVDHQKIGSDVISYKKTL